MNTDQTKIIELLREVHSLAIREVERLNLGIVELENQSRLQRAHPQPLKPRQSENQPEMLNERQLAESVKSAEYTGFATSSYV